MTSDEKSIYLVLDVAGSQSRPSTSHGVIGEAAPPPSRRSVAASQTDRDALYAKLAPLVSRLLRQYGDDGEGREDLKGELYCHFTAFLVAYDPSRGIPLCPYLIRQLTLTAYNFARRRRRARNREVSYDAVPPGKDGHLAVDPTACWVDDLAARQVYDALPGAVAALPTRQRQVVVWRYYGDLSFLEIAARLGVQPATARSLLRFALEHLRRWAARNRMGLYLD